MSTNRGFSVFAAVACAVVLGCTPGPSRAGGEAAGNAPASRPYVVLVSFDAFRYDYLDRLNPPAFAEIAARGVRAKALIPSFPSKTFPNHYTLVTGLYPGHHGIVGNTFFDPARRQFYRNNDPSAVTDGSWYSGEPIWVTAARNGVTSGVFYWPGSKAAVGGVRPSYWSTFDPHVRNAMRVDSAIAWLRKPGNVRPHLVLLYINELDDSSHKHGPDSPEADRAVASVDRALRRLLDSLHALPLGDSTNVVLVSDHGMSTVTPQHVIAVGDILARAGVDTTRMRTSDNGPTMSIWFDGDSARTRASRQALDSATEHVHGYLRAQIPARWHLRDNTRAGDVLLVADDGYFLQRRASDKLPNPGQHGYDPLLPAMHGIFLAAGPGVRPLGTIASFENVDVYPFVAALLHLDHVPVVDGNLNVLRAALR